MAFIKPSVTYPGIHCHNCRCPELGMNSMNRLCKASAKKGTKWWKEPPCEWCKSCPSVVSFANSAMETNIQNWGPYINDEASWLDGYNGLQSESFELGARITAPFQVPGNKDELMKGVVIGRYKNEHGPLHIRFDNGLHTYCLRRVVRKEGAATISEPASKSGQQCWEKAAGAEREAEVKQKKAAKKKVDANKNKAPKKTKTDAEVPHVNEGDTSDVDEVFCNE